MGSKWSSGDCPDLWWLRDTDRATFPGCAAMSTHGSVDTSGWKDSRLQNWPAPEAHHMRLMQLNLPTCSETLTVNCQPSCTEGNTTGCTEVRSAPQDIPMRDWDYRDRFEGSRTFKGEIQDNGSDAGYKIV